MSMSMDRHNGNVPQRSERNWNSVPATPMQLPEYANETFDRYADIRPGQSKVYDGKNSSTSVPTTVKRSGRRRQSFPQRTPATRNHLIEDEPMSPAIHAHSAEQQSRMIAQRSQNMLQRSTSPQRSVNVPNTVLESPGVVAPSMPKTEQREKSQSVETKVNTSAVKKSGSLCQILRRMVMIFVVVGALGAFFTMFDGVDRINEWIDIAANMNFGNSIDEPLLFCDTNQLSIRMADGSVQEKCMECPSNASFCKHGKVKCLTNYIERANRCVLDSSKIKFAYQIYAQISTILSERRGMFECGEISAAEDFAMRRDELLSHCHLSDESKKDEAFGYFEEHILGEASTLSVDTKGRYYSTKAKKSKMCRVREWALSNVLGLMATSVILCVTAAIWRKQKRKRWDTAEVERMLLGVYEVLEEYQRFTEHAHVPIDVVRQRVQPRTEELWQRVDAMIDGDKKIKRSLRMVDGMHKKCVQLTTMSVGAGAAQHQFGGNLVGAQANSKQW